MLEPSWVGRRVSVRRVIDRDPDGRMVFGDVVGDLLGLDAQTAVVESRSGPVEVPVAYVAAARLVAPSTADELALDDVVAQGWRAAETASIGGWLLRASGGFTRRGNSVLPLRAPGVPVEEAIERVVEWYGARGLPAQFQLSYEARRLLDADLGERGWTEPEPGGGRVHVMTARLDMLPADGSHVELDHALSDEWSALYRDGGALTSAASGLLTRHERVVFAALREDGVLLAIGRGSVDGEWLGVTAVEVVPTQRRRGLATQVMRALWAWGSASGARRTHLEVSADNAAGVALYERLGYRTHHDYHYRIAP